MRMSFPKLTPVVKWLLIINIGVFLVAITIRPLGVFIYEWFELDARSLGRALQVWRLISYQFLGQPYSQVEELPVKMKRIMTTTFDLEELL